jgi:hypothetical protein
VLVRLLPLVIWSWPVSKAELSKAGVTSRCSISPPLLENGCLEIFVDGCWVSSFSTVAKKGSLTALSRH